MRQDIMPGNWSVMELRPLRRRRLDARKWAIAAAGSFALLGMALIGQAYDRQALAERQQLAQYAETGAAPSAPSQ